MDGYVPRALKEQMPAKTTGQRSRRPPTPGVELEDGATLGRRFDFIGGRALRSPHSPNLSPAPIRSPSRGGWWQGSAILYLCDPRKEVAQEAGRTSW
jgi:hypothetical protein